MEIGEAIVQAIGLFVDDLKLKFESPGASVEQIVVDGAVKALIKEEGVQKVIISLRRAADLLEKIEMFEKICDDDPVGSA